MLLGKRSPGKKAWGNAWDMPGGHVEAGETFERALVREIEEEIGVQPIRFEPIAGYALERGKRYQIFHVDAWNGGEPYLRNHEHTELGWFKPAEARALRPLALDRYVALFDALVQLLERR